MARPQKEGLNYFPLDVDFLSDMKVRKIMRACGNQSIAVLISLLSSIYKDKGYYVVWDEDLAFLVADEVGASEGVVSELIKKALQVGFFSKSKFEDYKILTSFGIQKRYLTAVGRRVNGDINPSYCLHNGDSNSVNDAGIVVTDNRSTQSKVKENKEKKSKESITRHKHGEYCHVLLTKEQLEKLFDDFGEIKVKEYIKRVDEYCQQNGKSYKDYNLTIRNWINKDKGENNGTAGQISDGYNLKIKTI